MSLLIIFFLQVFLPIALFIYYFFVGGRNLTVNVFFFSFSFSFSFSLCSSYEQMWKDDKNVLAWLNESSAIIDTKINDLRSTSIATQIRDLSKSLPSAAIDGLIQMMEAMSPAERQTMVQSFTEKLQRM